MQSGIRPPALCLLFLLICVYGRRYSDPATAREPLSRSARLSPEERKDGASGPEAAAGMRRTGHRRDPGREERTAGREEAGREGRTAREAVEGARAEVGRRERRAERAPPASDGSRRRNGREDEGREDSRGRRSVRGGRGGEETEEARVRGIRADGREESRLPGKERREGDGRFSDASGWKKTVAGGGDCLATLLGAAGALAALTFRPKSWHLLV